MTKVIVAIPTYNRKEYLKNCLDSILCQTFSDFEIYVFDNQSDYDIEDFLSQFHNVKIRLLKSSEKLGGAGNFKRIFAYDFDSEYLVVFHDDDVMRHDFLERSLSILEQDKDIVFVGSRMRFVKNHKKINKFKPPKNQIDTFLCGNASDLVRLILLDFDLGFNSIVYRTKLIMKDIMSFTKKYDKWGDRPYLIELAKKGKVVILNEKLINYRIHKGQDSQNNNKDTLSYLLNLYNNYKENLSAPLSPSDEKLFYGWSSNHIILSLAGFADNFKDYLGLLKQCHKSGLFKPRYLNGRGMFYSLKVIKKYLC